jgi:hypothetical protein
VTTMLLAPAPQTAAWVGSWTALALGGAVGDNRPHTMTNRLEIDFAGEIHGLEPGGRLEFGRTATLSLDESNRFLHRVAGVFEHRAGVWWLDNVGSKLMLVIVGASGARAEVPPGGSAVITEPARVVVLAGRIRYEIEVGVDGSPTRSSLPEAGDGDTTMSWGVIPLNFEQRILLTLLCEPRLTAGDAALPANKEMAVRLGWTLKKLERKLDYLCLRFSEAGVVGLVGGSGGDANERRRRLADHVMRFGIIDSDDLALLDTLDIDTRSQ